MQIARIEILKLFGMFDHDIKLKSADRITIIHGPNGVGKSTILNLVKNIFDLKFYSLKTAPFKKIIISFVNKFKLELTKAGKNQLIITIKKGRNVIHNDKISISASSKSLEIPTHAIEDFIPF